MTIPKQILVLGGGFAGLWSAVGAARQLDQLGGTEAVRVTLVNRDAFHCIRVRCYESDLSSIRVPLDDVLAPVGVERIEADVEDIDSSRQEVNIRIAGSSESQILTYDRLVFALGSQLAQPDIPGLVEYGFNVDTYNAAVQLDAHLHSLPTIPTSAGQYTVIVVGAGLTGIEVATEMPARLQAILSSIQAPHSFRVILVDHHSSVGSNMGDSARPVIEQALKSLGIETRTGVAITAIAPSGVTLASGEVIPAATVVWCAGMTANPRTQCFPVERDRGGRIPVDQFMRVKGVDNVFAAGDAAWAMMDDTHSSVMSCQHSRPMGRFAGHNVVNDLLGQPLLPLQIEWYVTVLDLGPEGALYTEGWDRRVVSTGETAKQTKQTINCDRIYPPLTQNRQEIFAAADPVVQAAPQH